MLRAVLVAVFLAGPAWAQSDDIEAVIGAQLKAFASDDFEEAFTFASPMIRGVFGTPERFGQMVRNGYPMVWRPSRVEFGRLQEFGEQRVQTVYFTDEAGRTYEAAYEMIEGSSGWVINGVRIREADTGA